MAKAIRKRIKTRAIIAMALVVSLVLSGLMPMSASMVNAQGENGNLARGKACTYSADISRDRVGHAVDGRTNNADNYSDPGGNTGGAHWMQVDLGAPYKIGNVSLLRYWLDGRSYRDTVVMISKDENFAPESTLVLWNANKNADTAWNGNGNGQEGTHTIPVGSQEDYVETEVAKVLSVTAPEVAWLGTSDEALPSVDGPNYFEAQYVRVYMNGNYNEAGVRPHNHICELEVYEPSEILEAPVIEVPEEVVIPEVVVSGENIAAGKLRATYSAPISRDRNNQATDGNYTNAHNYADPGGNAGGAHWMQLDLEDDYDIEFVKLYRHWLDERAYNDTVVMISSDESFSADNTLVLWNANRDAEREWPDGNNQSTTHKLPAGSQDNYIETADGLSLAVSSPISKMLNNNAYAGNTFKGRYVRVYMNGNYSGNVQRAQNHVVELQVYGSLAETVVEPEEVIAENELPMVNLAAGKTVTSSNMAATNLDKIVDGKKYDDQYAALGSGNQYVTVDLGRAYSVEVINLKRKVGTTFTNTAVALANNEDFSDAQVIYYQNGAPVNNMTVSASNASGTYNEVIGGAWFYMDKDGQTPSAPKTVKEARYVRVYTNGGQNEISELAVYGYKNEAQMAKAGRTHRVVDNKNPLFISPLYSDTYYQPGQEADPGYKGGDTIPGRWGLIKENLKKNTVLLLHTDNILIDAKRGSAPKGSASERQQAMQEFYEKGLRMAYENGKIPTMVMGITASAVPGGNGGPGNVDGKDGRGYNVVYHMDYGWLDLMYRIYPNMEGTFNTENHWSGAANAVGTGSGKQLEIAARHNGNFVWTERADVLNEIRNNSTWSTALRNYGDNLYLMYKSTGAVGGSDMATTSYMQGSWLGGYAAGWGGLVDSWAWANANKGKLGPGNGGGWNAVVCYPEAMIGSNMLNVYLGGGCVYTFEHPMYTNGLNNQNTPVFENVIQEVMEYVVNNPAPSKAEVLASTKAMFYGDARSVDLYSEITGKQEGFFLYETGRFGYIPCVPAWFGKDEIVNKVNAQAAALNVTAPTVYDLANPGIRLAGTSKIKFFRGLYEKQYNGDAFAATYNNKWFVYNNKEDEREGLQSAVLPLKDGNNTGRLTVQVQPHTFAIADNNAVDGTLDIYLNNYRVDKDHIWDQYTKWNDNGYFCEPFEKYLKEVYIAQTKDEALRTTTFVINKLSSAPTVTVASAMTATHGTAQYAEPQVRFANGTATITIDTNGWVNLKVAGLQFVEDNNAEAIVDDSLEGRKDNVALGSTVTVSAATSNGRLNQAIDNNYTNADNYSDPARDGGASWLQLDMGASHEVEYVNLYRYWKDSRQYKDTVVLLSNDPNFSAANTLVLWNANTNANQMWVGNGNGQTTNHKLPLGDQVKYPETSAGKRMNITDSNVKMLDGKAANLSTRDNGEKFFNARYIRVYMNGSTANSGNHIVELQVWGEMGFN